MRITNYSGSFRVILLKLKKGFLEYANEAANVLKN